MTIRVEQWNAEYYHFPREEMVSGAPVPLPESLAPDSTIDAWLVETVRLLALAKVDDEGASYQWAVVPRYRFTTGATPIFLEAYSELSGQLRLKRAISSLRLQG